MSGFSPEWLALREPADRAARNPRVMAACAARFAAQDHLSISDLGAGTGSSLRAFADALPLRQTWTLFDHDRDNLKAARTALTAWADTATGDGEALNLQRGARRIEVWFRAQDLAADPACWKGAADLVTASALLDLTSAAWIETLVTALASAGTPLLATLSFDGRIHHDPAHRHDAAVARDFCRHQRRDKGFGVATGPDAHGICVTAATAHGYTVVEDTSDWILDAASPMASAVADGISAAVQEIGVLSQADIADWRASPNRLIVGHRDLFALRG